MMLSKREKIKVWCIHTMEYSTAVQKSEVYRQGDLSKTYY